MQDGGGGGAGGRRGKESGTTRTVTAARPPSHRHRIPSPPPPHPAPFIYAPATPPSRLLVSPTPHGTFFRSRGAVRACVRVCVSVPASMQTDQHPINSASFSPSRAETPSNMDADAGREGEVREVVRGAHSYSTALAHASRHLWCRFALTIFLQHQHCPPHSPLVGAVRDSRAE